MKKRENILIKIMKDEQILQTIKNSGYSKINRMILIFNRVV